MFFYEFIVTDQPNIVNPYRNLDGKYFIRKNLDIGQLKVNIVSISNTKSLFR